MLTAFVVESYTRLQQDPQDVIIGLLQQIATRNFVSGPGFINSTTAPPSPPPFEPPLWAIRVNILWFTSLILSLASASFGIIVKQWLREYLAIEYSAPRERLRARQFRNPALAQWKVFEIAAFLPILLQLSLGLFFLGLCFFTAAIHNNIGRTTTPLVCAWLFLVVVTTIAPLFSPRCPFRTTFLKPALRAGRYHIIYPLASPLRSIGELVIWAGTCFIPWCRGCIFDIALGKGRFSDAPDAVAHSLLRKWAVIVFRVTFTIMVSPVIILLFASMAFEGLVEKLSHQLMRLVNLWKERASRMASWAASSDEEEEHVIKTDEEDTAVLLSVDSLVSDDGLLPSMLDALLPQVDGSSQKVVQFMLQILGRRINKNLDIPRLTSIPNLYALSRYAWCTTTDTMADLLRRGPGPLDSNSPDWVFNSIIILLSPSLFALSDPAARTLHWALARSPQAPDRRCSDGVHPQQCLARVQRVNLRGHYSDLRESGVVPCLHCTMDVYAALLCQDAAHSHPSLRHLLDAHVPKDLLTGEERHQRWRDSFWPGRPRYLEPGASWEGLSQDLVVTLTSFLHSAVMVRGDLRLGEIRGFQEALHIVLQYGEVFERKDDIVALCRRMMRSESGTRMLLVHFGALHIQCRVSSERGPAILCEADEPTTVEGKLFMMPLNTYYVLLIKLDRSRKLDTMAKFNHSIRTALQWSK